MTTKQPPPQPDYPLVRCDICGKKRPEGIITRRVDPTNGDIYLVCSICIEKRDPGPG